MSKKKGWMRQDSPFGWAGVTRTHLSGKISRAKIRSATIGRNYLGRKQATPSIQEKSGKENHLESENTPRVPGSTLSSSKKRPEMKEGKKSPQNSPALSKGPHETYLIFGHQKKRAHQTAWSRHGVRKGLRAIEKMLEKEHVCGRERKLRTGNT